MQEALAVLEGLENYETLEEPTIKEVEELNAPTP